MNHVTYILNHTWLLLLLHHYLHITKGIEYFSFDENDKMKQEKKKKK